MTNSGSRGNQSPHPPRYKHASMKDFQDLINVDKKQSGVEARQQNIMSNFEQIQQEMRISPSIKEVKEDDIDDYDDELQDQMAESLFKEAD